MPTVLEIFVIVFILPIVFGFAWRLLTGRLFPQVGDRSASALLPPPSDPTARVRILFARQRQLRFVLGGHSWVVFKAHGADGYTRYDYDAMGEPIRNHGWEPNDPKFGFPPGYVWGVDGPRAEAMIVDIEAAVKAYGERHVHDYRKSIGPNSNTFIQGVIDAVPDMDAVLPPNALGKEYPHDGHWLRRTRTGVHLTVGGYASLRIGWIEGFEVSVMCLLAGVDWRRPAIKLPALGRVGLPLTPIPRFVPGSGRLPIGEGYGRRFGKGQHVSEAQIAASRGWADNASGQGQIDGGRGRGRGRRRPW